MISTTIPLTLSLSVALGCHLLACGIGMLPAPLWSVSRSMLAGAGARTWTLVTLLLGALLVLLGMTGTAGHIR